MARYVDWTRLDWDTTRTASMAPTSSKAESRHTNFKPSESAERCSSKRAIARATGVGAWVNEAVSSGDTPPRTARQSMAASRMSMPDESCFT